MAISGRTCIIVMRWVWRYSGFSRHSILGGLGAGTRSTVAIAARCSQPIAVAASFLSVAVFDFFCVPPYLTLRVSDYEYVMTFAGMLAVALVISAQTVRIRVQAADATGREARTETLYRLS